MALSEDELTRDDFEQAFLYEKVAEFIKPSRTRASVSLGNSISEDDEGTQKPNETGIEESKRAQNNQVERESILPLREFPKIGKFLRLLIILML